MTRYRYNHQVDPPAPFVYVTLLRPVGDEAIADIAAQLDTAADRTVVPLHLIEELGLVPLDEMKVIGFGGIVANVRTFSLRLALRDFAPVTLEVFGNNAEPHVLLGRDVLNRYRVLLDGPEGMLEVS